MAESLRTLDLADRPPPAARSLRPAPAPVPERAPADPHLDFLEAYLRSLAATPRGAPAPRPPVVAADRESFWELIGLRVHGCATVLLGAVRFQRQDRQPGRWGRRSLAHFLSAPPNRIPREEVVYPSNNVEIEVPEHDETIPAFLGRLESGRPGNSLFVDTGCVEAAFDFRAANPSTEKLHALRSEAAQVLVFRTVAGHVLTGLSPGLSAKLRRDRPFFGLTEVWQHTPRGTFLLPTLILQRGFLTMVGALPPAAGRARKLTHPAFAPAVVSASHLLDPRL